MKNTDFWKKTIVIASLLPTLVVAGTLSDAPLSLRGAVPPNVMFTLSVEYPTANTAAYQDSGSYSAANEYLGYFDPNKCYAYSATDARFNPATATSNSSDPLVSHKCDPAGYWSGNFLNWATMTGLDEFRYAMTGGTRQTDTGTLTVIERAYQSGQGGTGNFTNKTFTDTDGKTLPFGSSASITIVNQGKGVQMGVSGSDPDVAVCSTPVLTGGSPAFSCTLTQQSNSTAGTCSTWTGTGTSGSPYRCTSMSFGGSSPTTITPVTPAATGTGSPASTQVTCAGPNLTSSGGAFSCASLTLASTGSTTSCTTWSGTGSSGSPFTCTAFGTFTGSESFSQSGTPTVSSFSDSVTSANQIFPSSSTYVTCTVTSSKTTCDINSGLASGYKATCNSYTGSGSNATNAKHCSSFSISGPSGVAFVTASRDTTSTTTISSKYYNNNYRITYTVPIAGTYYYTSVYPGATAAPPFYYYSSYNIFFGLSTNYNVRVKVCDSTYGLESNCTQYGTSWKPTGVIQDNGDKMRFGVMSYFTANDTDNAVLRSKMKYVAPLQYSASGGAITNARNEWSATDGTLITDPDSSDTNTHTSHVGTAANSGVINYVNKFGQVSASYKTYDNISKLYYESLKYLRGLQPTATFYNGAKASNADGFPVISTWDDPIQYACQKNYIITMGDTHTHCDRRLPGGTFTSGCAAYTDSNSNSHVADYGSLGGDAGVNVTTSTDQVGTLEGLINLATTNTGANGSTYYMAGLAKWAASSDIRSDLAGKQTVTSYVIDVEENKDCGYQSQFWLTAKYGNPASYDSSGNWLTVQTTDQLWSKTTTLPDSACSSGRPLGYNTSGASTVTWPKNLLRAGDPSSMIASVKSAISNIVAQIGEESALAQSSGSLDTGTGAYLYRALFNSGGWSGNVQALLIKTDGTVDSTPKWSAQDKLPAATDRKIFTFNDGLNSSGAAETTGNSRSAIEFKASELSNLSSRQQALLNSNEFGTADSAGLERINYLRGDQSYEQFLPGTTTTNPDPNNRGWRTRGTSSEVRLLADFVNSNPVFSGPPSSSYASTAYHDFAVCHKDRLKVVYVGGNGGMLHAFDASYTITSGNPVALTNSSISVSAGNNACGTESYTSTSGKEIFAYVPSAVYPRLNKLMASNYSHQYFVDGSPTVADACFGGCSTKADWKTVLVGGLNAGGQGIYALDVTNPHKFDSSNVLWEFTDKDDADLGYTFSRPLIRRVKIGSDNKWVAIFGNGYNNTISDGSTSSTGRAYLYIVKLDGPGYSAGTQLKNWTLNTDYYKIELKSPDETATPNNPANGLGQISAIDTNGDGNTEFVYAGDRRGNLWKIDISSNDTTKWGSSFGTLASPKPLFIATADSDAGARQQITTGVRVVVHPLGGYMVLVGTGSWIDNTDPIGPYATDTFYGIWDRDLYKDSNHDGLNETTDGTSGTKKTDINDDGIVDASDQLAWTPIVRSKLQKQRLLAGYYSSPTTNGIDSITGKICNTPATNCQACTASMSDCVYKKSTDCVPNYGLATAVTGNAVTGICPTDISYSANQPRQLGWLFDYLPIKASPPALPASQLDVSKGERTRSSVPAITGRAVSFTTLTPATDPCAGNTSGKEYNLNALTGGLASDNSAGISEIPGGAVDNPTRFVASTSASTDTNTRVYGNSTSGQSAGSAAAATPPPPTADCTGAACAHYIPGWGLLMNLQGGTSKDKNKQWVCYPGQGSAPPSCKLITVDVQFGRLTWKQILR